MRAAFLRASDAAYTRLLRPLIFRSSAQTAHERMLRVLRVADRWFVLPLDAVHRFAFADSPVTVGGVNLPSPLILAAGLVKGDGFDVGSRRAGRRARQAEYHSRLAESAAAGGAGRVRIVHALAAPGQSRRGRVARRADPLNAKPRRAA